MRWDGDGDGDAVHRLMAEMLIVFVFFVSLRLFQKFDTFRILVCGGDGSVGWVLSEIDTLTLHKQVQTFHINIRWPTCLHGLKVFTVTLTNKHVFCVGSVSWEFFLWGQGTIWPEFWVGAPPVTTTRSCLRSWRNWREPAPRC